MQTFLRGPVYIVYVCMYCMYVVNVCAVGIYVSMYGFEHIQYVHMCADLFMADGLDV